MRTNDLKKGTYVALTSGYFATINDNKRGFMRQMVIDVKHGSESHWLTLCLLTLKICATVACRSPCSKSATAFWRRSRNF